MALTNVKVKLIGEDGNAFFILGKVSKALTRAGHVDLVASYQKEAMASDYDHLLRTTMKYVEVE